MKAIPNMFLALVCSSLLLTAHAQIADLSQLENYDGYVVKITNQQEYYEFASKYEVEMQEEFDFEQKLICYSESCHYCSSCPPELPQCHRNACYYTMYHHVINRIEDVKYELINMDDMLLTGVDHGDVIDTNEKFAKAVSLNPQMQDIQIDFEKEILIYAWVMGDCHAEYSHALQYDHSLEVLRWTINNKYGGCRAGGDGLFLLKTEKPKSSYLVDVMEIAVEQQGDVVVGEVKSWNDPILVGEWTLVSFENKPVDDNKDLSQTTWLFTADKFKMDVAGLVFKGSYRTDTEKSPNQMEMTLEGEDKGAAAIYKFEGGKLIIKLNDSGNLGYAKDFKPESHYDVYEFVMIE